MTKSLTSSELAYKDIYEQYVDEASFLWLMHTIAVDQPHYNLQDLTRLEQRINSQLNGLMTAIEMSWSVCEDALALEGSGEVFTAAVVAFRSHDQKKIQKAVEAGLASEECFKGLAAALAWLPANLVHGWIKLFFSSKDLEHKYLAVEACSLRRENPAEFLNKLFERDDCLQHESMSRSLFRIVGELKRHDLTGYVNNGIGHENESVRFWAIWSAILLGNRDFVYKLESYVFNENELQHTAIQLAFRVLPIDDARKWVSRMVADPGQLRNVIIATGVLGDPHAIDWLLLKMREIKYARVAAESFCMITGVDLEKMLMTKEAPEHYEQGPNEDAEDSDVKMHDDENLSWPNVELISSYWKSISGNFTVGVRYLLGKAIEIQSLKNNLNTAYLRQRHAIAYEIALLDKNEVLINTRCRVS